MKTVLTTLKIFEVIAQEQPINQARIGSTLGLPQPTVHRSLASLVSAGWIVPTDGNTKPQRGRPSGAFGRTYVVARKLGILLTPSSNTIVQVLRPYLEKLRDDTGESISFSVLEASGIVILEHLESPHSLRVANIVGMRAPVHASAVGKAILSTMSDNDRSKLLARTLTTYTETTITNPTELETELRDIQMKGYAVMRGEWEPSIYSIGTSLDIGVQDFKAGVGISGPLQRFNQQSAQLFAEKLGNWKMEVETLLGKMEISTPHQARQDEYH